MIDTLLCPSALPIVDTAVANLFTVAFNAAILESFDFEIESTTFAAVVSISANTPVLPPLGSGAFVVCALRFNALNVQRAKNVYNIILRDMSIRFLVNELVFNIISRACS